MGKGGFQLVKMPFNRANEWIPAEILYGRELCFPSDLLFGVQFGQAEEYTGDCRRNGEQTRNHLIATGWIPKEILHGRELCCPSDLLFGSPFGQAKEYTGERRRNGGQIRNYIQGILKNLNKRLV